MVVMLSFDIAIIVVALKCESAPMKHEVPYMEGMVGIFLSNN